MPDWVVDWLSDPLTALFAVYVTNLAVQTDSVPDWVVDWVSDCLAALLAVYVTDLAVQTDSVPDWVVDWVSDSLTALFNLLSMCLTYWWTVSIPDWIVNWVSDSLAALFAVDVTDLVVDWPNAWLSGCWVSDSDLISYLDLLLTKQKVRSDQIRFFSRDYWSGMWQVMKEGMLKINPQCQCV